jgi:hypothetical protein
MVPYMYTLWHNDKQLDNPDTATDDQAALKASEQRRAASGRALTDNGIQEGTKLDSPQGIRRIVGASSCS